MKAIIKTQRNLAFLATVLFLIKIVAWWHTQSLAILTDALESIVNVVMGFFGWYSVWLSNQPKDKNHPYGHGKVEFLSAAIEGTLISLAGVFIIFESFHHYRHPMPILQLDLGLLLLAITAVINCFAGIFAIKEGKKKHSATVEAEGHHLLADTYSTTGIIVGLIILKLTNWLWLDVAIALVVAAIVLINGYKVLRSSLAGIMDEADTQLLQELVEYLNENRRPQWIDLHNLRIIKYGNVLHLDGHLTLPWYYNVRQAHAEITDLHNLIKKKFGDSVELFLHVDDCLPFSCEICELTDCPVRLKPFKKRIKWTVENVLQNKKHHFEE